MSSENNKISNPHRPLLKLSDKVDLRRSNKYFVYQILPYTIHGKLKKNIQKQ